MGTHQELVARADGIYRRLYELQYREATPRATRARLASMVARGLVREVGRGPQDPKRKYYLAQKE